MALIMDRYQEAHDRHLNRVSQESLREQLLNVLEYQPLYLSPIPPPARERFKMHLTRMAERVFAAAFVGRYRGEAREHLEAEFEQLLMRLRREIHSAVTEWDRLVQQQGRGSHLVRSYPQSQLHRALMKPLRDIFQAGLREGYLARMHRLGEEVATGVSAATAQTQLLQELPREPEQLMNAAFTV